MPPVSVTMQPRNLLVVDALVVLDALDEAVGELAALVIELDGLVVDVALDVLLPQAASSKQVLAAAAAMINAVCLTVSPPVGQGCRSITG
jgi:hypothetical protein